VALPLHAALAGAPPFVIVASTVGVSGALVLAIAWLHPSTRQDLQAMRTMAQRLRRGADAVEPAVGG
jgi:hypothetical protein